MTDRIVQASEIKTTTTKEVPRNKKIDGIFAEFTDKIANARQIIRKLNPEDKESLLKAIDAISTSGSRNQNEARKSPVRFSSAEETRNRAEQRLERDLAKAKEIERLLEKQDIGAVRTFLRENKSPSTTEIFQEIQEELKDPLFLEEDVNKIGERAKPIWIDDDPDRMQDLLKAVQIEKTRRFADRRLDLAGAVQAVKLLQEQIAFLGESIKSTLRLDLFHEYMEVKKLRDFLNSYAEYMRDHITVVSKPMQKIMNVPGFEFLEGSEDCRKQKEMHDKQLESLQRAVGKLSDQLTSLKPLLNDLQRSDLSLLRHNSISHGTVDLLDHPKLAQFMVKHIAVTKTILNRVWPFKSGPGRKISWKEDFPDLAAQRRTGNLQLKVPSLGEVPSGLATVAEASTSHNSDLQKLARNFFWTSRDNLHPEPVEPPDAEFINKIVAGYPELKDAHQPIGEICRYIALHPNAAQFVLDQHEDLEKLVQPLVNHVEMTIRQHIVSTEKSVDADQLTQSILDHSELARQIGDNHKFAKEVMTNPDAASQIRSHLGLVRMALYPPKGQNPQQIIDDYTSARDYAVSSDEKLLIAQRVVRTLSTDPGAHNRLEKAVANYDKAKTDYNESESNNKAEGSGQQGDDTGTWSSTKWTRVREPETWFDMEQTGVEEPAPHLPHQPLGGHYQAEDWRLAKEHMKERMNELGISIDPGATDDSLQEKVNELKTFSRLKNFPIDNTDDFKSDIPNIKLMEDNEHIARQMIQQRGISRQQDNLYVPGLDWLAREILDSMKDPKKKAFVEYVINHPDVVEYINPLGAIENQVGAVKGEITRMEGLQIELRDALSDVSANQETLPKVERVNDKHGWKLGVNQFLREEGTKAFFRDIDGSFSHIAPYPWEASLIEGVVDNMRESRQKGIKEITNTGRPMDTRYQTLSLEQIRTLEENLSRTIQESGDSAEEFVPGYIKVDFHTLGAANGESDLTNLDILEPIDASKDGGILALFKRSGMTDGDLKRTEDRDGITVFSTHGIECLYNGQYGLLKSAVPFLGISKQLVDEVEKRIKADSELREYANAAPGTTAAPPIWVEKKGMGSTIHFRNVPDARQSSVEMRIQGILAQTLKDPVYEKFKFNSGAKAYEVKLDSVKANVDLSKGAPVAAMVEWKGKEITHAIGWGDDTTDIDQLKKLTERKGVKSNQLRSVMFVGIGRLAADPASSAETPPAIRNDSTVFVANPDEAVKLQRHFINELFSV